MWIISSKIKHRYEFIPFTEKNEEKKFKFVGSGVGSRTGSGSVFPEADPHQNEAVPKHWKSFLDSPLIIIELPWSHDSPYYPILFVINFTIIC